MGNLKIIKIDNSKKAAIAKGKWRDPGAKLYDTLMDAMWCEGDIPASPEVMEEKIKEGKYYHYDEFIKEAYLVAPVKDIKNSPYGRTPFARSGCKYPHHVIKGDKIVVSIPGLRAAYITARNQGCFHPDPSKRPEYSRSLVAHLNRHLKELKIKAEWHHGEFYLVEESAVQIDQNFQDIYAYINESLGINLTDDIEGFEEKIPKPNYESYEEIDTVYSDLIDESLDWIDRFVHDDYFRESAPDTYVTDDPDRELIYKGDEKLPITGAIQHTTNWTLKYRANGEKGTFETKVIQESTEDTEVEDIKDLEEKKNEPFVPIYGIIKSYSSSEYRNDGTKKSAGEIASVKFDKIIHKVTRGDNYSHALVSFDDSLTEMYSYEDEGFCIDNILTKESWMSTKSIYICVMFVRESDRDRMKAYVNELKEHPEETRYAMGNLLKAYIATPTKIDKRFVCSSFTGFIMSCSNPKNLRRDYSRMRPDDITLLPRAFYVANVQDREEFKARYQEIRDRVNAIYDEYKEDIDDYNNHLPRIMLQDRVDKYKTIDKIFDWIINKLA